MPHQFNNGEHMAKIFIATPMYGGQCTGAYVQSLLGLVNLFSTMGHQVACAFMFNESLITRARNNMAHQFLQTDNDYLLWIDADIRFRAEDALRMLQADKDIIGGIYPKKEINWDMVRKAAVEGKANLQNYTGSFVVNTVNFENNITVPLNEPCEVFAIGTGFMLIKREVFEKMKEWTPQYRNDMNAYKPGEKIYAFFMDPICPDTGRFLSEDYFFCNEWRRHGGKIYAAPWCQLGHMGSYMFEGMLPPEEEAVVVKPKKAARKGAKK
jgi:hypothetical protein